MKTTEEVRQAIVEQYGEESLEGVCMFEGTAFVDAIIGFDVQNKKVIYDYEKMAECLMNEDGMTYEEAVEFIEYNTIRTLPYMENPPIIAMPIMEL